MRYGSDRSETLHESSKDPYCSDAILLSFFFVFSEIKRFSKKASDSASAGDPDKITTWACTVFNIKFVSINFKYLWWPTINMSPSCLFFSVQAEIDQVKDIMVANIDVIIERGEKLELLVDKTEHLATNSITFRWNCLLKIYYSKLYRLQEYFKKPSACHMVEKHEIDYWSGFGGHSLSLCCGITCLWGSCLVQMCGLKSLLGSVTDIPCMTFAKSIYLSGSWQVEWDWIIHSLQTESWLVFSIELIF